jgi:hypothetical protein
MEGMEVRCVGQLSKMTIVIVIAGMMGRLEGVM